MDLNTILNFILILCAIVLVVAFSYRIHRARSEPSEEAEEDRVLTARRIQVAPSAREPPLAEEGQSARIFARIASENPDEVRRSARRMLDYAILRGGATHVRPEVLGKIALQFGLLEVVLRDASRGEVGPCVISDEQMSEMLRESFRRAASQARD